ncbi:F-box only protein 50-like [Notolabrus celidotus]|uniref:F-box only protein 50-like n=1 Tax=Notolabrus celidotus TaxID=1203425 RepID=UPI001490015B|nr:F-box only protein 50-like [Notolabrus celidotus]
MKVHTLFWISVISLFVSTICASEWKKKCEEEWGLQGAPMPDSLDWESVYEARPLGRNLLKNPSPHGLSKDNPPPNPNSRKAQTREFSRRKPTGNFNGWNTSTESLPVDRSGFPPGAVVCGFMRYVWFSLEQVVDLKAEGLWDELLDEFQPEIVIQDWYEESKVAEHIYELHVTLLSENMTVISEHSVQPTEDRSSSSYTWKEVSHVFSGYGSGLRYVRFQHRLKNKFGDGIMRGFYQTMFCDSSVIVKPTKSSS